MVPSPAKVPTPCVRVYVQVLEEVGVDLSAILGAAPQGKVAQQAPAAAAATSDSELQDLQARLAMLRS